MTLGMLWLTCYNSEIDQRPGEVKMMRCLEECGKQQRLKQEKLGWQKQKEKEKKEEEGKKCEEKEQKKKEKGKKRKKPKKERMIEVKKVVEEWEIWGEEKKVKKLVPKQFYWQIHVF